MRPLYIRIGSAQEVFGLHRSTIYRMAKRGQIKIHRRGSSSFLQVAEIERWITEGPDEGPNQPGNDMSLKSHA